MSNLKSSNKAQFDVLSSTLISHQHELPITSEEKSRWDNAGDVMGSASSTPNAIVRFSGSDGKTIQDYTSGAPTVSDTGLITATSGITSPGPGAFTFNEIFGADSGVLLNNSSVANTVVGSSALAAATSASYNVAVGASALNLLVDGIQNTAVGMGALNSSVDGDNNVAVGASAMNLIATGDGNVAIGFSAAASMTSGDNNVILGLNAMRGTLSGSDSVVLGVEAAYNAAACLSSVIIGAHAAQGLGDLTNVLVIDNKNREGMDPAQTTENGALVWGQFEDNPKFQRFKVNGYIEASFGVTSPATQTVGLGNEMFGMGAGGSLTIGMANAALGTGALGTSTDATNNTALGYNSMGAVTTSSDQNTAVGGDSLNAVAGDFNTGVGYNTLPFVAGSYNTTLGAYAGKQLTAGSQNIFIGPNTGSDLTTANLTLIVDCFERAMLDPAQTSAESAILYGVMSETPANQVLTVNAAVTATYGVNIPTALTYKIAGTNLINALNNGFVSDSDHTISINESNRTVTITPVPNVGNTGTFKVVSGGLLRTYTGTQTSSAWTDTSGQKYVFFNSSGVLTVTEGVGNAWTFTTEATVTYLYWNAAVGAKYATTVQEEDHLNSWAQDEWRYHHQVFGTRWISGYSIYANAITAGSPNADGRNTCVSVSGGTTTDESERVTIQNSAGGGNYQQVTGQENASGLTYSNAGVFDVLRYDGTQWLRDSSNQTGGVRFPFLWNSSTNVPRYVTSLGAVTDITVNGTYFAYFLCVTHDWRTGKAVYMVPANTVSTTLATLQAAATVASLGTLPNTEMVACYRLIFQYNSAYSSAVKYAKLYSIDDLRPFGFQQVVAASAVPAAHASTHMSGGSDMIPLTDGMRATIDGQGFAITAGTYIDLPVRFASTITGWTMLNTNRVGATDQISIEVQRCTYAQYDGGSSHPVTGDKISASAPITLASAGDYKNQDTTLTGWTTSLAAGDIVRFYVSSATAITNVTFMLNIQRA